MLTIDPSQKKLVAILMVILVSTICITVFRIAPSGSPEPDRGSGSTSTTATAARRGSEAPVRSISRNPFKAPDAYRPRKLEKAEAASGAPAGMATTEVSVRPLPHSVPPLGINFDTRPEQNNQMQQLHSAGHEAAQIHQAAKIKPAYTLLAVVGGDGKMSAIIKTDESKSRIINLGDVLDGSYRVSEIKIDRVVLTNGRDIILVKKPKL